VYIIHVNKKQEDNTMKYAVKEKDYINGEESIIFETEDKTEAQEFADAKNAKRISNEVQYIVVEV